MKSVQLVDNKGIAAKITANTPGFSIHKNATARKMQTAGKKIKRFHTCPKAGFQTIFTVSTHSIWLVGSEFFCFYLFSLNEQSVKSELMLSKVKLCRESASLQPLRLKESGRTGFAEWLLPSSEIPFISSI